MSVGKLGSCDACSPLAKGEHHRVYGQVEALTTCFTIDASRVSSHHSVGGSLRASAALISILAIVFAGMNLIPWSIYGYYFKWHPPRAVSALNGAKQKRKRPARRRHHTVEAKVTGSSVVFVSCSLPCLRTFDISTRGISLRHSCRICHHLAKSQVPLAHASHSASILLQ